MQSQQKVEGVELPERLAITFSGKQVSSGNLVKKHKLCSMESEIKLIQAGLT